MTDLEQFLNDANFYNKLVRESTEEFKYISNGGLICKSVGYDNLIKVIREFEVNLIASGKIKEVDGRFIENL